MAARLLIHADDDALTGDGMLVRALRQLHLSALAPRPPVPTRVQIDDLQGHSIFAAAALRAPIDVPLPAGTYHVSVRLGERQRRYTVTLEQGTTVDLHLRRAKEWS